MRHATHHAASRGTALDLEHHLPVVDLGNHQRSHRRRQLANASLGEGPDDHQPQRADLDATPPRQIDRQPRDPGGDAVGHHHDVGAVGAFLFEAHDVFSVLLDLVEQALDAALLALDAHQRIAALVVRQTCGVEAVAVAGAGKLGHRLAVDLVGFELFS